MDSKFYRLIGAAGVLVLALALALAGIKLYRVKKAEECGILLAFDDYNPENWSEHFALFEEYGVHVTFFVALDEPTEFCQEAIKRGHEIGFHTRGHCDVTTLTEEEIQEKVIDPIETFKAAGIKLTSFAYPYGARTPELDEKLLAHYNIVRGAYSYELHSKADLRKGYIDAYPIDNYYLSNDDDFAENIDRILAELADNTGAVSCLYSHAISGGDWCVTEEHLRYLLEKASAMGLKFYTFSELQD